MQKAGKIQQAFAALKELADISPESAHLREMLEEHLQMYGAPERRPVSAPTAPPKPEPREDPAKSGKRKTSSLVFLDVDEPPGSKGGHTPRTAPAPKPPPVAEPEPEPEPEPVEGLIEPVAAEPDASLDIESTSLVAGLEPTVPSDTLEGFETTSAEFGDVRVDPADVPSLREDVSVDDVAPMAELEPTVSDEASAAEVEEELEPLLDVEIELPEPTVPKATPRVSPVTPKRPGAPAAPPAPAPRPAVGPPPRVTGPKQPAPKFEPPRAEPAKVKPVVPKRPPAPPPGPKTVVEVPPLELEPDFDSAATDAAHEVDDQPLAIRSEEHTSEL